MRLPGVFPHGAVPCWLQRTDGCLPVLLVEHHGDTGIAYVKGQLREVATAKLQYTPPERLVKQRTTGPKTPTPDDIETAIWRLADVNQLLQLETYSLINHLRIPELGQKRLAQLKSQIASHTLPNTPQTHTTSTNTQPPPRSTEAREQALQQRLQHLKQHDYSTHPCPCVRLGWSFVWQQPSPTAASMITEPTLAISKAIR